MKKAFGVLLVLALILCLSMTAFAAEADNTEIYQNKITPTDYELVINEAEGETLAKMDVANNEYKVVEVDGYYYLGDETGPQILVNLNDELMPISGMFFMSTPIYDVNEDGTWVTDENGAHPYQKSIDFTAARDAYIACADNGYYPLTTDLAYMIQTYGLNQGWWGKVVDPSMAWYIFYKEDDWQTQIDVGEDVWLYACSYVQPCQHTNVEEIPEKKPTCHTEGWNKHWYCPDCDTYFADSNCAMPENQLRFMLLPTAEIVHEEKVEATCSHQDGNIEYWFCPGCNKYFTDEALTNEITEANTVLTFEGEDNLLHNVAKAPTCHNTGCEEHWVCTACDAVFQDSEGKQLTNAKRVQIPTEIKPVYTPATEASCHDNGIIENWYCTVCKKYYKNVEMTEEVAEKDLIQAATGSEYVEHVEAAESICHELGNCEYWHCLECDGYWTNEALTQTTNALSVKRPAKVKLQKQEALEPTCHQEGWTEYWYCPDCGSTYTDAQGNIPNTRFMLPAKGSDNVEHVAAKAPTATATGNVEYWHCKDCDGYWTDEALAKVTNGKSVILPVSKDTSPATGDNSFVVAFGVLMALSVAGAGVLVVCKKKFDI